MEQTLSFYQTPGTYTDIKDFCQLFQALPDDNKEIINFIKKVLIHPIDAKNSDFRFDFKKALRSQIDHRSIDDILASPKVNALLKLNSLDFQSEPSGRGILSCDHHAVFFASILRLKGRAVRARCGYATYIVPSKLAPHWICEVYDIHKERWVYIDPERIKLDVDDGEFFPAGKVWLEVVAGRLEIAKVIPDYRRGLDGIKYRLLNDINALMKNELLNYGWIVKTAKPKAPIIFSKPVIKLDESENRLLETLATLSSDVDANWERIRDLYATYVQAENL